MLDTPPAVTDHPEREGADVPKGIRGRVVCSVDGCDRLCHAAGMCSIHYKRFKRNGDPTVARPYRPDRKRVPKRSLRVRLLERSVEDDHGCWIWTGVKGLDGYGLLTVDDRSRRAHRVSYEVFNGPIPDGLQVCHRCDVTFCIHPDHLFVGTPAQNTADMIRKGRARPTRGEAKGTAVLTEEAVKAIRSERSAGASGPSLAAKYGVSVQTIHNVAKRKNWKHVP